MAKAELKTQATDVAVADFIAAVPDPRRRDEAAIIDQLHRRVTGLEPKMWGPSIIGYGSYDYKYDSGREGTMCRAGFSPRKAAMTLYLMGNYCNHQAEADELFARLGSIRWEIVPVHQAARSGRPGSAGAAGGAELGMHGGGLWGVVWEQHHYPCQ